ncbi:hypothetical protein GCM10025867_01750 [Frondihabitans sucicola]|uniref:Potassium-transporting ATPase subunit KdpA n=1 Tax=Frondihabitans sucicola TaxID=1268041 RepID=A0ABN6XSS7_9MICO|nr:hypothetical protein GCM10025867_01750 [Frondihabitans sucicola]
MSDTVAGLLQILTLVVILVVLHRPVGSYLAWIYRAPRDWRLERGFYRLIGVDSKAEQTWRAYLRGVLIFSAVGVVFVYVLQRLQAVLPYSLGFPAIPAGLSFNTAASFVTNTNWQSYSPTSPWAMRCSSAASWCRTSCRRPWESPSRSR